MKTPDVIIKTASNGTKYAIATGTELNAVEKKQPVIQMAMEVEKS